MLVALRRRRGAGGFVAQRIPELRDEGRDLNKIAVLYRSHFHALELQLELTRQNIPFNITSGIRFFEQAHIKDIAAYLKFIANPRDELAFKRIVRLLEGVGGKTADKLWAAFTRPGAPPRTRPPPRPAPPLATALQRIARLAVAWAQLISPSRTRREIRRRAPATIQLVTATKTT